MSFIEVTIDGSAAYLRACIVSGVLPDIAKKSGCVIYCDPPIGPLSVEETTEEVFAMLYDPDEDTEDNEDNEEEEDEEEDEDYEDTDQYVTDMMKAWNINF